MISGFLSNVIGGAIPWIIISFLTLTVMSTSFGYTEMGKKLKDMKVRLSISVAASFIIMAAIFLFSMLS